MREHFFIEKYFQLHQDDDQLKRQKSSISAKLTPISINVENETGLFKGSAKNPYLVTLDHCDCGDFRRRKFPCKHMYRLAAELNMFNPYVLEKKEKVTVSSGTTSDEVLDMGTGELLNVINKQGAIENLKNLSTIDLRGLQDILYSFIYGKDTGRTFIDSDISCIIETGIVSESQVDISEKLTFATKVDLIKFLDKIDVNLKNNFKPRAYGKTILKYILEESNIDLNNMDFNVTLIKPNEYLKESYVSIYRALFKEFDSENLLCLGCYEKSHDVKVEEVTYITTREPCNECWENNIIRFRKQ